MRTLRSYLLAASGFAILVFALLLASPQLSNAVPPPNAGPPAQDVRVINTTAEPVPTAAQGTTTVAGSVTVANTAASPVPVVNINDAGQPFQATASTNQSGTNVSTLAITTVPAGKRLVIEFISFTAQVPPGQHAEIMSITTNSGPGGASHQLLIHAQPQAVIGDSIFRAVHSLRLYANAGTQVSALFRRNTSPGTANFGVTISGYLVDMP